MEIFQLVYNYQNGDTFYMEKLISKFNPLITKYSYKFSDQSDAKSELTLCFIQIINSIKINRTSFPEEKYLISYISRSMQRAYYALAKKEYNYNNHNILVCSDEEFNDFITEDNSNLIFNDLLKYLSHKEAFIIIKHYLFSYKEIEISHQLNISRQNVHISKTRALNKLKKSLAI